MTQEKRILRAWVICVIGVLVAGALAYGITKIVCAATNSDQPPAQTTSSYSAPSDPYDTPEPIGPFSTELCKILAGKYLSSEDERKALDNQAYGFYQGVKDEDGVLAGFLVNLHDFGNHNVDLAFLNQVLSAEVVEECTG